MTNFTDRASWIAFRADWKVRYAAASATIRARRRSMIEASGEQQSNLQSSLHCDRRRANSLMDELNEAKEQKGKAIAALIAIAKAA